MSSGKKGKDAIFDEEFALERCVSRITEMQSKKYLEEDSYLNLKRKGKLVQKTIHNSDEDI